MDMLCIMHQAEPEGYLLLNGDSVTPEKLAVYSGCNADVTRGCMAELLLHGVSSVSDEGVIYCRRMVRDAEKRGGTRERVAKYRKKRKSNAECNDGVTPLLEASNQKPEGKTPQPPKGDAPPKRLKFIKPTIEEVRAYAASIEFPELDAETWMAHYESNGWKVGRNAMKSWKAAVVTWKKDRKAKRQGFDPARPDGVQGATATVDEYYEDLPEHMQRKREGGEG